MNKFVFRRRQSKGFTVRVGSTSDQSGGLIVEVRRFFQHGSYRPRTLDFDFSLIQLSTPLNFTNQTQSISLPNTNYQISDGTMCTVSGWGN